MYKCVWHCSGASFVLPVVTLMIYTVLLLHVLSLEETFLTLFIECHVFYSPFEDLFLFVQA